MIDGVKARQTQAYTADDLFQYQAPKCMRMPKDKSLETLFEHSDNQEEIYPSYSNKQETINEAVLSEEEKEMLLNLNEEELALLQEKGYEVEVLDYETIYKALINIKNEDTNQSITSKEAETVNNKIKRLKEHTDSMYTYAMQSEGTLTINDLYKGSFTGSSAINPITYTKQDIQNVLNLNGIELNTGNEWAADKLLNLGMEVSKGDVLKIQNIQAAVDGLESFEEGQQELEELQQRREEDALIQGEKLLYDKHSIEAIQKDLAEVDDRTIQEVIKDGELPNIQNLREKLFKNTEQITSQKKQADSDQEPAQDIGEIKKQINEIRARLNTESAQRLSSKMPLESSELAKVAEGLRQVDLEIQEEALVQADVEPTDENKQILEQVMDVTQKINQHKEFATITQMPSSEVETLEQIHGAINSYEVHFSEAEVRFGESIKSVEMQIENFLEVHNLPTDTLTVESAKALIQNEMDLTVENLEAAKQALSQINDFLEVMNPYMAAKLIKEGINPYHSSVPNVLEWSKQTELKQTKETVARAIVSLEEKGLVNEEQKQSLIGLYKILNGVVENKEQVAGYLFKNQLPLTVEQLQEAVRYSGKKSHIEANIDDNFGELESLQYDSKTAKNLINEANEELKKLLEAVKVVESMPMQLERSGVDELEVLKSMLMPFVKATVKKELGKFDGVNTLPSSLLEKVDAIKGTSKEVLEVMKEHKIPLTISNIYWVDQMSKDPELYNTMLKETGMDRVLKDKDFPDKMEDLEKVVEELREESHYHKEMSMEQGDILNYKNYKQLEEMLDVQKQLMDKEGFYQIPYCINGETKLVQFYVKEESKAKLMDKEGLTGIMRYETKELGTITTYFTIKGEHIGYEMRTESQQAAKALEKERQQLQQLLGQLGYQVTHEQYKEDTVKAEPIATQVLKGESEFEVII